MNALAFFVFREMSLEAGTHPETEIQQQTRGGQSYGKETYI